MNTRVAAPEGPRLANGLRDAGVLGVIGLLCFAFHAWDAPLFDLDEGAFSQATLEMLASGNWLTTTLDGLPRYDKPLLTYWLQGIAVTLMGVTELAFRLPSVLAAGLWLLASWWFVRDEVADPQDDAAALFGAGALGSALMVGVVAHAAIADALLNLWLALSFFDLWRWLRHGQRRPLLRLYLWIGLGLLTKGPVAAVLPLLSGLVFCTVYRRGSDAARALLEWRGWLISLAVLAVWLVPLVVSGQLDFAWQFLIQHNVGRYAEAAEGHGGGPFYYLVCLPFVLLPFSALLPRILSRAPDWRQDPLLGLSLAWLGVTLLLFSFASTKLPHYILYGCTPLFVLFGREALGLQDRRVLIPGLLFVLLLAALPLWLPWVGVHEPSAFEHGILTLARESVDARYTAAAVFAAGASVFAWFSTRPVWKRLLLLGAAQGVVVWMAVVPLLFAAQQQPVREAAMQARALGLPTVAYKTHLPSFSVYRGAPTPHRAPEVGELVFLRRDRIERLRAEQPDEDFETLYENGGVALLRVLPATDRHPHP